MRFLWNRKRKKQPRLIDLKSLSRKIIAKRMKADPAFGEEIAMRELNYFRDEPEPAMFEEGGGRSDFKSFMKDFKQMKDFMGELRGGGGGDNKSTIMADILNSEVAKIFAQNLATTMKTIQQGQPVQIQEQPPQQPQIQEQPQIRLQPQENVLSLADVRTVLEQSPENAVTTLTELNADWLPVLASSSVEGILSQIEVFLPNNADLQPVFDHLRTNTGKKWLAECISEAQKRLESHKPENKGD